MRFLEKYKCLILFLYLSISFSIDDFINIKNISSLINSNEIISFNNKITSLTDGGIYTINSLNQLENKIDYLTYSDLNTAAIDQFNRLWVGGSSPYGYIQILNSDFELLFTLDYANFNEIKKIVFTSSYAFAISENNGEYSIIKFSNNDNPSYLNVFNDFPLNNLIINDLVVMNDKLFLGTNNGLLEGDVNSNFLLFSSEWSQSYSGIDIKNIFFNEQDFYVISDNQIFKNDISIIDLDVDIFEAIYYDDQLYCLTENQLYSLGTNNQFNFNSPSQIWDEMARLTPSMSGINYDRLENEGGLQWPCPDINHPGTRYLYKSDFPRGDKAKFFGYKQGPRADEMPGKKYPLTLITGRILYHWHGGTITKRSEYLLSKANELEVSINPKDSSKFGIKDGDWISVESKRGRLEARARLTDKMSVGEIFVPFVKLQNHAANFLTNPAVDPDSKIPEYKVCAVKIKKSSVMAN